MSKKTPYVKQTTALVVAASCIALSSIGGADIVEKARNIADQELFFAPIPKAVCGPGDKPESGLQGQVPIALRMQAGGFQGFSCNLQLISQIKGEGASWQNDEYRERGAKRKACAYHSTASPESSATQPGRTNFGVRAIDISNPAAPVTTAYLTTRAMLYPHESLKVNDRRQLLGAVRGDAGPEFDVYDVGGDCAQPQLLASVVLEATDGTTRIAGHEGMWAPDGLTYYGSAISTPVAPIDPTSISGGGLYYAIDTTDTTKPKVIYQWQVDVRGARHHGLSLSEDGNRGYVTAIGSINAQTLLDDSVPANNGLVIYDLSDIQARRPNPQRRVVGSVFWKDGSGAQMTIPVTINKKPYIIHADEGGSSGARTIGCPAGFAVWNMARIIDVSDETKPKVVSKLMLETHDPANCAQIEPDLVGLTGFLYGSHYCSVDNRRRATTLACGYFNSGIRIFDIRDPIRPREIAYYNPAYPAAASPGSGHTAQRTQQPGGPDWCPSQVHLDAATGTVWSSCMDNGFLMLKFTHNAWPFAETTTPPGLQN